MSSQILLRRKLDQTEGNTNHNIQIFVVDTPRYKHGCVGCVDMWTHPHLCSTGCSHPEGDSHGGTITADLLQQTPPQNRAFVIPWWTGIAGASQWGREHIPASLRWVGKQRQSHDSPAQAALSPGHAHPAPSPPVGTLLPSTQSLCHGNSTLCSPLAKGSCCLSPLKATG